MKTRTLILASGILAAGLILPAGAATKTWVGDTSNDFNDGLNWSGDSLPNLNQDIMSFPVIGSQGNANIINVGGTFSATGAAAGTNLGQIRFETTTPSMTLGGGTITFLSTTGTYNNAILAGGSNAQTIASDLVIGTGSAFVFSVVNSNSTFGTLNLTGNITGGSGAVTPGSISLGFGNVATQNGNYSVSGNITPGGASAIAITKRGSGTLTLSGNNVLAGSSAGLGQNEAGSVIRITGGTTSLSNGSDNQWGGNNITTGSGAATVVRISGGVLNAQSARNLRSSLLIDGGTLNIGTLGSGTGRLSFDSTAGTTDRTFTMSSGAVNLLTDGTVGTSNQGVRFGNDNGPTNTGTSYNFVGNQSGGTFTVYGRSAVGQGFSLGSGSAVTTSYNLSGGTLEVRGDSGNNVGFVTLGADAAGIGSATLTLSGSGKLIVRTASTTAGGITGGTTGARQVLALQGGTLVAGRIDAANLRGSLAGTNGTIVNNGANVAPGDVGSAGRSHITGDFTVSSGKLSIDLGGTLAANTWQHAASSGRFDLMSVSGIAALGGNLEVSLIDGFNPVGNSYQIMTFASSTGSFVEGASGTTVGGLYTFDIAYNSTNVTLSNFALVPEPSSAVLIGMGLAGLGAFSRRSRRR